MTPGVQFVDPRQPVVAAATLMRENDVGSLPVVDNGRLVGIVTDRDIVMRGVAERADLETLPVGLISSPEVLATAPGESLDDALHLMARHRVRRLPVVEDGRLVGILAQADVAIVARDKAAGEMLEEISQPTSHARS
jgi:CBS domain-containing protein